MFDDLTNRDHFGRLGRPLFQRTTLGPLQVVKNSPLAEPIKQRYSIGNMLKVMYLKVSQRMSMNTVSKLTTRKFI